MYPARKLIGCRMTLCGPMISMSCLKSDANIVVEVIGGLKPAGDWISKALSAGKSVVTANKQVISRRGDEFEEAGAAKRCHIVFGASVAGGVPVISGLEEGLAGDELFRIYGILNGTCNYILSQIETCWRFF